MTLVGVLAMIPGPFRQDHVRNVRPGEIVPAFELPTLKGEPIRSAAFKDRVVVLVYLSAEQRSSELAAADAQEVVTKLDDNNVTLLFVTADVVHKSYFEELFEDKGITATLALDPDRTLYGALGLIVFPTTVVIDREGRLKHVISTRGTDYANSLDAYTQHTLGRIDDAELVEHLKIRRFERTSPRSLASRHRATARLLRSKGMYDEAASELRKALELDAENLDISLDLADLLLKREKATEAQKIVEDALVRDPRHRRAKLLKGMTLFQLGQLDEAEVILLDALVLNPDPARTHYYLGRIYEKRGDKDRALQHYREAINRLLDD